MCDLRPKLCENCAFLQNVHISKLGEITIFYQVISNFTSCEDSLPKNSKSNETMIICESNRGRWISLRAVVSSFLFNYFSLLKYQRFYLLFELYHCIEKLSFYFSLFKTSITHFSLNFTTFFRKLVIISCIWKMICYFSPLILTKQFNLIELSCCEK